MLTKTCYVLSCKIQVFWCQVRFTKGILLTSCVSDGISFSTDDRKYIGNKLIFKGPINVFTGALHVSTSWKTRRVIVKPHASIRIMWPSQRRSFSFRSLSTIFVMLVALAKIAMVLIKSFKVYIAKEAKATVMLERKVHTNISWQRKRQIRRWQETWLEGKTFTRTNI